MEPLHFSFLTVFSPACGINIPLRGEENGFCIEMRQPLFLKRKNHYKSKSRKTLMVQKPLRNPGGLQAVFGGSFVPDR